MEINKLLKQLKRIEPDSAYSLRSRSIIMGTLPGDERAATTPWQMILHSLQFGSAVALAGLLLVLILGGFSTWRFLSPFRLSSLDPASLKAEAEAIDVQLEVAKIHYSEPQSTAPTATAKQNTPEIKQQAETEAKNLGIAGQATTTDEVTVNDALDELAQ